MEFRYREVRKEIGFTLEQAAKPMGRSKQWLSQVERGSIKLDYAESVELAKVYGGTPDIFLPRESNKIRQRKSSLMIATV
ncbi:MAG: Helix-turn-helix domain [Firmicutes bacterium]|nr:Helix-turn-helix domain [Bacillota bacterium]